MNKYEKWYAAITNRAKTRLLESYTESHHIKPRSLGGDDSLDNLVQLTAREHFICHWLLTKFTSGDDRVKMLNALRMMRAENPNQKRYKTKITARVYEHLKKEYSIIQSIERKGAGNGMFGKKHTEEAKEKIRKAHLGSKLTDEQIEKVRQSKLGKKRKPFSEEWLANIKAARQGEKKIGRAHV